MKIVAVSDVHSRWHDLAIPECDLLISAGDYTFVGEQSLVRSFHTWLSKQPAKHIISLQGNHEVWVERNFNLAKKIVQDIDPEIHFIDEGPLEIMGKKIWCSAITPWFHDWAWNKRRGADIKKHWDRIPDDTQILITHGPAYGILDQVDGKGEHLGCRDLLAKVDEMSNLQLHVFGHIHTGHGEFIHFQNAKRGKLVLPTKFINASICDEKYQAVYKPQVIDLEDNMVSN